jgi:hypothetical protein
LVNVEIRTLDDVLKSQGVTRVDVIKIDVQGYEMETLRGMRECLAKFRPALAFEYDAWAWRQANVQPAEAFDFLQAAGYELFRLDGPASATAHRLDKSAPLPDYLDLLARPSVS